MQCTFNNIREGEIIHYTEKDDGLLFILGTVTMRFLDRNNIFDDFQEDDDFESAIIFRTSKDQVVVLADKIDKLLETVQIREDLTVKLKEFSKFVRNSNGLIAEIE